MSALPHHSKRRHFLKLCSALAAAGAWPVQAQNSARSRLAILIYLKGGNDGFNTVVPFTNARYYRMRPTIAVPRDQVIGLNASHGFHPALAPIVPLWQSGKLALVQGIGLPEVQTQHFSDYERLVTAAPEGEYLREGWLTRAFQANPSLRTHPLDGVAFGSLDIREGDAMGPFRGEKRPALNVFHASEWLAEPAAPSLVRVRNITHHATPAARTLLTSQANSNAPKRAQALATAFPDDEFGQALRAAVELARDEPALPVIHLTLNALDGDHHHAFDTHWRQLDYHGAALSRLAHGLVALTKGLQEIGRWDDTLVATYDEFGRAPPENHKHGTHHGWANTQFVLGGRVKGGFHGKAPELVDVHEFGGDAPVIDYRSLYTTLIETWWGGNAGSLFDRRYPKLDLLRA